MFFRAVKKIYGKGQNSLTDIIPTDGHHPSVEHKLWNVRVLQCCLHPGQILPQEELPEGWAFPLPWFTQVPALYELLLEVSLYFSCLCKGFSGGCLSPALVLYLNDKFSVLCWGILPATGAELSGQAVQPSAMRAFPVNSMSPPPAFL